MAARTVRRSVRLWVASVGAVTALVGFVALWASPGGTTIVLPSMPCCSGSTCCGLVDRPCLLTYGAEGTVTDARDGRPIAQAVVDVSDLTTTSNADGTFSAFGTRLETCNLDYYVPVLVVAPGYVPYSDPLNTSVPLRHLEVQLQPIDTASGFTISGVVAEFPFCEGGMPGVTVVLNPLGLRAPTDVAGFFAFAHVPPGDYTLTVDSGCNLYGCWDPYPVSVTYFDVWVLSICPQVRRDAVRLSIGHVTGQPGATAEVDVALHTNGAQVAGVTSTITFAPEARIAATADRTPDCEVVADVASTFAWLPAGCTPGLDCNAVRTEVQAGMTPPIDGAVLFRCRVAITDQPVDTCSHLLRCLDLDIRDTSGAPFDAMCENGKVTSESPRARPSFHFAITPEHPMVGDRIEVRVTVGGDGGNPRYSLRGVEPLLAGETSVVGHGLVSGTVTYELDAIQSGTASLVQFVNYEALLGCPGNMGFDRTSDESEPFVVEIGAADATPTPTPTPTATPTATRVANNGGDGCAINPADRSGSAMWLLALAALLALRPARPD